MKRYSDLGGGTSNDVAVTDYTWDYAGRLAEIKHTAGSTPGSGTLLAGYGYEWNQRNELTALDFLPDGSNSPYDYTSESVDYDYDALGQLLTSSYGYGGPADESYQYDDNGNRTDVTNDAGTAEYDTGADNRLTDDGTYRYEYDAEGNRTRRYVDDDESETFNSGDTDITEYAWDHRNRLVSVTEYATYGGNSTQQVDYTYDAFNQLIKRVVDPDGDSGSDPIEQTIFLWENGQIVLQFDGEGTDPLDVADLSHRYLWGPGVDQLLVDEAVESLTNASLNERRWALTDHLGTIRDWIDDAAGLLDHAEYDSAGRRLNTPAIDAAFGFQGLLHDKSTGNNYNRNRWSDPDTGGFLSEDPIKDGTNWRVAYGNAAVMFVDPNGLQWYNPLPGAMPGYPTPGPAQPGLPPFTIGDLPDLLEKLAGDDQTARDEAGRIGKAVGATFRNNNWWWRLRAPWAETYKGYYCYEWAYGLEDAVKATSPQAFGTEVQYSMTDEANGYRVHYWLRIYLKSDPTQEVFVDDGFWPGRRGAKVHKTRPHTQGSIYLYPPRSAGVYRRECTPVTPFTKDPPPPPRYRPPTDRADPTPWGWGPKF